MFQFCSFLFVCHVETQLPLKFINIPCLLNDKRKRASRQVRGRKVTIVPLSLTESSRGSNRFPPFYGNRPEFSELLRNLRNGTNKFRTHPREHGCLQKAHVVSESVTIKTRSVAPRTLSFFNPIQIPTPLPAFRLFSSGDGKSSRILVRKSIFLTCEKVQEALFRFMSFSCCLCKFFNSSVRVFKLLNYRKSYVFNRIL